MQHIHVGLSPEIYKCMCIGSSKMQEESAEILSARKALAQEVREERIAIFGSRDTTGGVVAKLLPITKRLFVNSQTITADVGSMVDAIVIGTSPAHYESIVSLLKSLGIKSKVYTLFDCPVDDDYLAPAESDKATPCHYQELFIRHDGNIFPCCWTWKNEDRLIGNIRDSGWFDALGRFSMEACSCKKCSYRNPRPGEAIRIRRLYIELSLNCNSRCAMCIAHAPEFNAEHGLVPCKHFDQLADAIGQLNPEVIYFQGGEVLIQQEAVDFIKTIKQKKPSRKIYVLSNGNNAKGAAKLEGVVDHWFFTLYGFQRHTYKTITGMNLNQTIQCIENVLIRGGEASVNYLATPLNIHEASLFLEWAVGLNVSSINILDASVENYINYEPVRWMDYVQFGATNLPHRYWQRILQRTAKRLNRCIKQNSTINIRVDGLLGEYLGV